MKPNEFIPLIVEQIGETWVLPSITIAQSALESSWGESELCKNANNLFGIKANNWTGKSYNVDSREVFDGVDYVVASDFRAYDSWADSIADHDAFLTENARYAEIVGNPDYVAVANLLQSCGYATATTYAEKLIQLVELYDLTQYDVDFGKESEKVGIKICLDAGHYAYSNQSTEVSGYWESKRMWDLHLLLKADLEAFGIDVITTRTNQETDLALVNRGYLAKGCDMFLSLHSNACGTESVDYPLVIYPINGANNSKAFADELAKNIDLVMGTTQDGKTWTKSLDSDPTSEYYGVMRGAKAVGCPLYYIVEHSFHTNKNATNWLLNDDNLRKLSAVIAQDVAEQFRIDTTPQGHIDPENEQTSDPVPEIDPNEPSQWASSAWEWGVGIGITTGERPKDVLTREEQVFMLHKYAELTK